MLNVKGTWYWGRKMTKIGNIFPHLYFPFFFNKWLTEFSFDFALGLHTRDCITQIHCISDSLYQEEREWGMQRLKVQLVIQHTSFPGQAWKVTPSHLLWNLSRTGGCLHCCNWYCQTILASQSSFNKKNARKKRSKTNVILTRDSKDSRHSTLPEVT